MPAQLEPEIAKEEFVWTLPGQVKHTHTPNSLVRLGFEIWPSIKSFDSRVGYCLCNSTSLPPDSTRGRPRVPD